MPSRQGGHCHDGSLCAHWNRPGRDGACYSNANPNGNQDGYPWQHSNSYTDQDACHGIYINSNQDAGSNQNAHPDADANCDSYADSWRPDCDPNSNPYTDAYQDTDTNGRPDANPYSNAYRN